MIRGQKWLKVSEAAALVQEIFTANGWSDLSAEPDSTTQAILIKDISGENPVLLASIVCYTSEHKIYYNNGNSSYTPSTAQNPEGRTMHFDVMGTSHGVLIRSYKDTSAGYSIPTILTREDNGKITIIDGSNFLSAFTPVNLIVINYNKSEYQSISYIANSAVNTSLTNIAGIGEMGEDTSCKYAYFMPLYQYNNAGILTINDVDYISNGFWCVSDE